MEDSLHVWAAVDDSVSYNIFLLHTTDGGLHWKNIRPIDTSHGKILGAGGRLFTGVDNNSIYLVNHQLADSTRHEISWFDLLFTTDGGSSWQVDSSNHRRLTFAASSGKNKIWAFIGERDNYNRLHCDTLAYSPNNGKNWYYDTQSIKGDSVVFMKWIDSTHGYIISYKDSTITFAKFIPFENDVIGRTMPYLAINIVPTITSDILHFTSYQPFNGTITFYDILGRLVLQKPMTFSNNEEKDISLSGLSRGMYFITYSSGGMSNFARVIKE